MKKKTTNFEKVQEFHRAFLFTVPEKPKIPYASLFSLRVDLIEEELDELRDAYKQGDIVAMADAVADLLYVVYGAGDTFGLPVDLLFTEVHRSNMTKLGEDGKPIYRADGKILKGPGFEEPKLEEVLKSWAG